MPAGRPPDTGTARTVDGGAPDPDREGSLDVLQVGKYYHPTVGGVERVVRRLAEGLRERGHEARVLVARKRGRARRETVDGVPVRRATSLGSLLSVPVAPGFVAALARARRGADVIHYHLPNPLAVAAHLALPEPDAAVVATYHSDIVRQSTALRLYEPLLDRFLRRLDHVFVTSPPLRDSSHLRPVRERTSVVPLTVPVDEPPFGSGDGDQTGAGDTTSADAAGPADGETVAADGAGAAATTDDSVDADPLPATAANSADHERPTVLFVGRLSYYKGVETLVAAMTALDADLVVVGDGDRRGAVKGRVEALGLDDRVHLLGHVSDSRLHRWYEAADVFVLPSVAESEAFGVVQLEAMAHGLPVVNTDLATGVPWVSPDGETGLTVPPEDPAALATALRTLLTDDDRRRQYGDNARQRVERRFSEPRMVDAVEDTYRALLAADPTPSMDDAGDTLH